MKHMENKEKKRRIHPVAVVRAAIQLAAFILVPGLFITVFGAIGEIFTSLIGGVFVWEEQLVNVLTVAAVFLITFIWGRVFCGFLCSFGAMQDLLWLGGKHIPFRPVISQKADRVLKYLKYFVLAIIVIAVWGLGLFGDVVWSPWTVFGAAASPWKGLPPLAIVLSIGGALLLLTIIGSLLIERFFCKYLCPLGALFALASRFRLFKIKRSAANCSGSCRVCTRKCSMSVPIYQYEKVNSGECINCMKCTAACARGNIKVDAAPAVTGALAAVALAGVSFAGTIPTAVPETPVTVSDAPVSTASVGKFKNGIYTGSAQGFRSQTVVSVKVENGNITDITVDSSGDDREFLAQAEQEVIPAIIAAQDTEVDTVSGATFSSRGIINAVSDALGTQLIAATTQEETKVAETTQSETEAEYNEETETAEESEVNEEIEEETEEITEEPEEESETDESSAEESSQEDQGSSQSDGGFTDGVYSGSGSGFRGTTSVEVTVNNGSITDITITSYQDDDRFFNQAQSGVISSILSSQSVDVDTVSGATFSSNSIIEAVADALGQEFYNPNSSMGGGHGH